MRRTSQEIGFLFDLDGVLIDSEKEYSRIWSQINKEFPTGIDNLEQVIKGTTLTKILNDYFTEENKDLVSSRLHELENQMKYEYLPYAEDFLKELKARNLKCVLVTSSDKEKMKHLKEEIEGLTEYFDYIITGDLVKTSKPSPEGYLLGASKINVNPKNCVVFEDSLQGVMAGQNSRAFVVGVKGTIPTEKLQPYSDIIINNFNDIDLEELIGILTER